jgi:hypothetical protein
MVVNVRGDSSEVTIEATNNWTVGEFTNRAIRRQPNHGLRDSRNQGLKWRSTVMVKLLPSIGDPDVRTTAFSS